MCFLIEDDNLLEKCNTIWNKVIADIKKNLIASMSITKMYENQIKYHGNEVINIYDKEIPKVDSNLTCLAVISLDSALDKDGNYYP